MVSIITIIISTISICLSVFNLLVFIGIVKIYNPAEVYAEALKEELERQDSLIKSILKRKNANE